MSNVRKIPKMKQSQMGGEKEDEILQIIKHQMEYIDQLEKENKFVMEKLASFKGRLEAVVRENQAMHDAIRSNVVNQTIDKATLVATENIMDLNEEREHFGEKSMDSPGMDSKTDQHRNQAFKQWKQEMENVKAMYEAKIEGLEAEVKLTKKDLEIALRDKEEAKEYSDKMDALLRMPGTSGTSSSPKNRFNKEPLSLNANVPLIERLTKERDDLMKSIASMRNSLLYAQKQESCLRQEVQKSFAKVEDIQLEKAQAKMENDRIRKDLELTRKRLEAEISNSQQRITESAATQRRNCQDEMNELLKKVGELTAVLSTYENNLEAAGREKSMLTTQLEDARRQLLIANEDLGKMRSEIEFEVRSTVKGYKGAEEELRNAKSKLQQELIKTDQERVRFEHEASEQQRRLAAAQKEALASNELNVTLTQQLNDALHKLQDIGQLKDKTEKEGREAFEKLQYDMTEKQTKLEGIIHQSEIAYEQRLSDLEAICSQQSSLIQRLRQEGKTMEVELEKLSKKFRSRVGTLSQDKAIATARLTRLLAANKELEEQVVQHGITHREMQVRLRELDERSRRSTGYASNVMEENDRLVQDKSMLQKEVEFLQSQILIPDH